MNFDGVDMDKALQRVVDDMERAALKFKARRYAPKEQPKAEEPAPKAEPDAAEPTASELEAMLNGG